MGFDSERRRTLDLEAHAAARAEERPRLTLFFCICRCRIVQRSGAAPRGEYAERCGGSYLDGLALADRELGNVLASLKSSPRWKDTTVIVEGDHSWRLWLWNDQPGWMAEDAAASVTGFDAAADGDRAPCRADAGGGQRRAVEPDHRAWCRRTGAPRRDGAVGASVLEAIANLRVDLARIVPVKIRRRSGCCRGARGDWLRSARSPKGCILFREGLADGKVEGGVAGKIGAGILRLRRAV